MRKSIKAKTPLGDFKATTPKNSLFTSGYKDKESYQTLWPIPKYQPIVDPYPNTQLDLYYSGNLYIQCTNLSM